MNEIMITVSYVVGGTGIVILLVAFALSWYMNRR